MSSFEFEIELVKSCAQPPDFAPTSQQETVHTTDCELIVAASLSTHSPASETRSHRRHGSYIIPGTLDIVMAVPIPARRSSVGSSHSSPVGSPSEDSFPQGFAIPQRQRINVREMGASSAQAPFFQCIPFNLDVKLFLDFTARRCRPSGGTEAEKSGV